jgi:hypothetical protein
MSLTILTRDQFVQNEVDAVQAALPNTYIFSQGSIVLALTDAHSTSAMWLQANQQYLYNRERLATSTGEDCDTFVEDFGLTRLPAVAATGEVTFASYVNTTIRTILIGSTVATADGISFAVTVDDTNPNYDPNAGGYVMGIGISTVDVPVQAVVAGTIGNVGANTITVITSPITGVDTVSNALSFQNGQDQQTDTQLRQYFVDYLNSLSRATLAAIIFAIESYQEGLQYIIVENIDYTTGATSYGQFFAVIDDGTGSPPTSLINGVSANINLYRGLTIRYQVYAPVVVTATIAAQIILPAGYSNPDLIDDVKEALTTYINSIPFAGTLYYTRIAQVIYDELETIAPSLIDEFNVTSILLNGGTSNLAATYKQKIRVGTLNITTV